MFARYGICPAQISAYCNLYSKCNLSNNNLSALENFEVATVSIIK